MMTQWKKFWRCFCRKRFFPFFLFFLVFLLLCGVEYGFSNRLRFEINHSGGKEQTLDLSQAKLSGGAYRTADGIYWKNGSSIVFENVNLEVVDVAVCAFSDSLRVLDVTVSMVDDANKRAYRTFVNGRIYTDEEAFFRVHSSGNLRTLRLECKDGGASVLTGVTLNRIPKTSFSVARVLLVFALIVALWCIWHFRAWKILYLSHKQTHRMALCSSLLVCMMVLIVCCSGARLQEFPYRNSSPNAYEQLFASLLEGRLDLDVDCDTDVLDSLENPYDHTERGDAMDAFGPFWDRAYYQGRFYCYFGIAPVILIFFPFYWLTGCIPNSELTILCLLLIAIAALFGTLLKMVRYFRLPVSVLMLCLGFPVLVMGSMFLTLAVCADMYYVAVASGLTFLSLTFCCGFSALCSSHPVRRRLLFLASGVSLALTVASRPTVVLYAAILIPPFLAVLTERGRSWAQKLLDATSFLLPLLVCMIPILWYNAARFDSPFEFGARYQLTMSDISYNQLSFSLLGETVLHYFLQAPQYTALFPYLRPSYLGLNSYGSYFYSAVNLGALSFPLAWGGLAQGFVIRKHPVKRASYGLLLVLPFVVAFCDLCLGGVNIRYLADILLPLMLVGILVLAELSGTINRKCSDPTSWRFFCGCFALLLATAYVAFALIFANERNWIYQYSPAFFRIFESIFS